MHHLELRTPIMRNNLLNHGSLRLKLRKPSRSPAFSRLYMPGDPINMIDWKIFARTDQLLVREENDESSAKIVVLVDCSDTMRWPSPEHSVAGITKLETAWRIGLHLAYIHLRMSDNVSVVPWRSSSRLPEERLPMKSATDVQSFYFRMIEEGMDINEGQFDGLPIVLGKPKVDKIYWISDCLDGSRISLMEPISKRIHLIHCLSSLELNLDWISDDVCYYDQSGVRREYLGNVLRERDGYYQAFNDWRRSIEKQLFDSGNCYQMVSEKSAIHDFHRGLVELATRV